MSGRSFGARVIRGLLFKLMERGSVLIVSLGVSILLARLLDTSDYSMIAMVNIVLEIVNVFVNYGLSAALIHHSGADQEDMSTCFWGSLIFGVLLYGVVFVLAGPLAAFFREPALKMILRVMGVQLIFTMVHSVQVAIISKRFQYARLFWVTLASSAASGVVGVVMALKGCGVWALVAQSMCGIMLPTVLTGFVLRWKPDRSFSLARLKGQIAYSWRLLISGFVDCLYAEIRSVIIARISPADLAFYNKGTQFPKLISNTVNQSVISVLFPSFSVIQSERERLVVYLRRTVSGLTVVILPVLCGLAAVAEDFVLLLLTEKWLPCAAYMQILCLAYMITPVQSVFKQALKALGRTRSLLMTNAVEKGVGLVLLLLAVPRGIGAICWSFVMYHVVGLAGYMLVVRHAAGYCLRDQLRDVLPAVGASAVMTACVLLAGRLPLGTGALLAVEVLAGAAVYTVLMLLIPNEMRNLLFRKLCPARRGHAASEE
ncbi:MAG: lipopolysaccharide biosynthesis protein [Clostridia bacterium]|nr:lipopolysaccharide biosynthesis protein [Clostridia bacterium]